MTFKAVVAIGVALVGAAAVAIHLCAPELMHHFGHLIHGH